MAAVVAGLPRSRTRVDIRQVDLTDRAPLVAAMTAGAAQLGPNLPPHLARRPRHDLIVARGVRRNEGRTGAGSCLGGQLRRCPCHRGSFQYGFGVEPVAAAEGIAGALEVA